MNCVYCGHAADLHIRADGACLRCLCKEMLTAWPADAAAPAPEPTPDPAPDLAPAPDAPPAPADVPTEQ